jgi:hypothetical protein
MDTVGLRTPANNYTLTITGGCNNGNANGAQIDLVGNTACSFAGVAQLMAGDVSTGHVYIKTANDKYRITALNNGNVGVRTSTPTHDFEVNGNTYISGTLDVTGAGSAASFSAGSFNTTSSRIWKENIQPINNALGKVKQLKGVTFDWNNKDLKNDIGFIAEEVNEILPTIIGKTPQGQVTGLEYGKITALLVEAIKELSDKLDKLQKQ